jgi:hypothetical protein
MPYKKILKSTVLNCVSLYENIVAVLREIIVTQSADSSEVVLDFCSANDSLSYLEEFLQSYILHLFK